MDSNLRERLLSRPEETINVLIYFDLYHLFFRRVCYSAPCSVQCSLILETPPIHYAEFICPFRKLLENQTLCMLADMLKSLQLFLKVKSPAFTFRMLHTHPSRVRPETCWSPASIFPPRELWLRATSCLLGNRRMQSIQLKVAGHSLCRVLCVQPLLAISVHKWNKQALLCHSM